MESFREGPQFGFAIVRDTDVDPSMLMKIIFDLEQKGWIEKCSTPAIDGYTPNHVWYQLTRNGRWSLNNKYQIA